MPKKTQQLFLNNRFYPQNFILRNCSAINGVEIAEQLADEAKQIIPDLFNGTEPVFSFQLRYCPPYQSFLELKRLQTEAIYHTHFKDEYRGLIQLDMSEWVGHADEEYFSRITIPFLSDMTSEWHYIFCFDGLTCGEDMLSILQETFWCKDISDQAQNLEKKSSVIEVLQKEGITFIGKAPLIIKRAVESVSLQSDMMPTLIRDIQSFFGQKSVLTEDDLVNYLKSDTYMHCLLKDNQISMNETHEKESA